MNILIISPYFAPFSGVGALRMNSLAAFLQSKGEQVTVLRFSRFEPELSKAPVPLGVKILEFENFGSLPADILSVTCGIIKACKSNAFDCILYSCGPFPPLFSAPFIRLFCGVPYIIDFRDLWAYQERKSLRPVTANLIKKLAHTLIDSVEKFVEKRAVVHAGAVVTVCTENDEKMREVYPRYKNFFVVMNGYDDSLTQNITLPDDGDSNIYIALFGKLSVYSEAHAEYMFRAVKELNQQGTAIKILHVGEEESKIKNIMERLSFDESLYINTGAMWYTDGLSVLSKAKILFIVPYNNSIGYGTKIFDYIYLNKPVIIVAEKNAAVASLVGNFENAFVCKNKDKIKEAIEKVLSCHIEFLDTRYNREAYSRSAQNSIFNDIIKNMNLHADGQVLK